MLLILPSDGRFKNNYQKKENFCKMPSMPSSCVLVMGWVRWEPEKRGGLDRRREMVKEHRGLATLAADNQRQQMAATIGSKKLSRRWESIIICSGWCYRCNHGKPKGARVWSLSLVIPRTRWVVGAIWCGETTYQVLTYDIVAGKERTRVHSMPITSAGQV